MVSIPKPVRRRDENYLACVTICSNGQDTGKVVKDWPAQFRDEEFLADLHERAYDSYCYERQMSTQDNERDDK